ncbi:MAG: hypothetical protein HYY93_00450 [Planctomycetes bacterium]|nr:hypothetical protein [Planctomycetota bacterium]
MTKSPALSLRKRDMQALLEEHGLRLRRRHGQNFAIDPNFLDGVVREAGIAPTDTVLEIGHGLGVLTARLAAAAGRVVAVEIDAAFAELAPELVPEAANISWVHADALSGDGSLAPEVFRSMGSAGDPAEGPVAPSGLAPGGRAKPGAPPPTVISAPLRGALPNRRLLVSNLPYRAATPIFFACLAREAGIDGGCVVVQREVAERWAAAPGSEAYGAASVGVQAAARPEIVRRIPPEVFWPRPRVESALVRFESRPDRPDRASGSRLQRLTTRLFSGRRKTLVVALTRLPGVDGRAAAGALCRRAGLDPTARAETLPPEAFLRLSDFFSKVG